jgi:hypothetical protein
MIKLPNYDDQTFEDIMEMARRRIPVLYPQWTDLNEHDPGITLLELFAWLKEMEQYYLNRITTAGYESMLRLLGITVREPVPAKTRIVFTDVEDKSVLPRGMRFKAAEDTVFECPDSISLGNSKIKSVLIESNDGFKDVYNAIREPGIYCHAFGEKPVEGLSALYIGFDDSQSDKRLDVSLYFYLDDTFPVKRNPFGPDGDLPREILWEYGAEDDGRLIFKPVKLISDKTYALSLSGDIIAEMGEDVCPISIGKSTKRYNWLRARLVRRGCEENPRIAGIYEDTAVLEQRRTFCETIEYTISPNCTQYTLKLDNWLGLNGGQLVFIRDASGWLIHNDIDTEIEGEHGKSTIILKLENLPGKLADDGRANIRVLCYENAISSQMLYSSNGLPCQSFPFSFEENLLTEDLKVMVCEETDDGQMRWLDWNYISRLSHAGPYDRFFTYNRKNGKIIFGDNEQGAVPPAGKNNIIISSCVTTRGSAGNIPQNSMQTIEYGGTEFKPYNPFHASGGSDGEEIMEAVERVRASMNKCVKAVTAADYEELAANTPGLRVMWVHAIPFYDPDSRIADAKQCPAVVTIVAVPFSETLLPVPDQQFLQKIRRYLEDYRLVTTQIKVIGPKYIKISIYAEVVLENGYEESISSEIKRTLEKHFSIQKDAHPGSKPKFGEPVRESVLVMKIGEVQGVSRVKRVMLGVKDSECYKDRFGNIVIPLHAIPCLGEIQIRTLSF